MFEKPRLVVAAAIFLALSCCLAASQSKNADQWAMDNAQIGPASPIEIPIGGSYDARVMYPVPDGPLYPLKADVTWWIEPAVKGIFVEAKSGKITVAQSVPHGTTATLHADVSGRKEKLNAKLVVYSHAKSPLVGTWKIESSQGCDRGEPKTGEKPNGFWSDADWKFYADDDFWIGRPFGIRAGVKQDGTYRYDAAAARLKLTPKWPMHQRQSEWQASLKDDGATLELKASKPQDGHEAVCGYTLRRADNTSHNSQLQ